MTPHIAVPRSYIYEWYIGRCSCPKCCELLTAPAYSEFLKGNNIRHTWMCNKCDYEFETLIWFNIPPGDPCGRANPRPGTNLKNSAKKTGSYGNS
jgi:hypothetical protein